MKAGVYCTSWDYAGGGEKLMAVTAERLRTAGWEVTLFGRPEPEVERLESVLNVDLSGCRISASGTRFEPLLERLGRAAPRVARAIRGRTDLSFARGLDLLVYVTGEMPPWCPASRGVLFVQFPYNPDESIQLGSSGAPLRAADREKLARLHSWSRLLCPSEFVKRWVERRWRVAPDVAYPPAEISECTPLAKTNTILTVGRFYATGPTKKHAVMVKAFRELCEEGLEDWRLIVVGGTHEREDHRRYLDEVRALAEGYPVDVITDLAFGEVVPLYGQAPIYWHATGAMESPDERPELFEQFGMTVVEAMASGAVPVVYDGGGPAEIVRDGEDGFVWRNVRMLKERTLALVNDPNLLGRLSRQAVQRSAEFTRRRFEESIDAVISSMVPQAGETVGAGSAGRGVGR